MIAKIKVEYEFDIDDSTINLSGIDKKIRDKIESAGGEWYAQGFNPETRKRDICFELNIEEESPAILYVGIAAVNL